MNLATSEMWCWSGGRGTFKKLSLCYSIVYCYNGAQWYEQFWQVGRLYRALILLGLALGLPSAFVSSVFVVLYRYLIFLLTSTLPVIELSMVCLDLVDNHRPSVLWCCWLGHLTCKIVSEMTYNVSCGTLNPAIPYHTLLHKLQPARVSRMFAAP